MDCLWARDPWRAAAAELALASGKPAPCALISHLARKLRTLAW